MSSPSSHPPVAPSRLTLVYSLFALCEYTVVGCNIFFHSSLACDLPGNVFVFGPDRKHAH